MTLIHLGQPKNWLEEQLYQTLESNLALPTKSQRQNKNRNQPSNEKQNHTHDVVVFYSGSRRNNWQKLQAYYYQGYCLLILFPPQKIPMEINELQQCEFEPGDVLFVQKGLEQENQENLAWRKKTISLQHLILTSDETIEMVNNHSEKAIDRSLKNNQNESQNLLTDISLNLNIFLQASCERLDHAPPINAGYMAVCNENLVLTKSLNSPNWSAYSFEQTPSIAISTTVHILLEANRDDTHIHSDFTLLVSDQIKFSAHTESIMPGNNDSIGRMYFITRVTRNIELSEQNNIIEVKCISGSPERQSDIFNDYKNRSLLVHENSSGCIGIPFTVQKSQHQLHQNWKAVSKKTNAFPTHSANTKFHMAEPFDIEENPWNEWKNWYKDKIFKEGSYKFKEMTKTSMEKNLTLNSQSIWHVTRKTQDTFNPNQPTPALTIPTNITLNSSIGLEIGGYGWEKGTNTVKALRNSNPYTKSSNIYINLDDNKLKPNC